MPEEEDDKAGAIEGEESLDELQERRVAGLEPLETEDELEYTLPGDDDDVVSDDLDSIRVLPKQADEFICQSCFLVFHTSQRYKDTETCKECSE